MWSINKQHKVIVNFIENYIYFTESTVESTDVTNIIDEGLIASIAEQHDGKKNILIIINIYVALSFAITQRIKHISIFFF